MEFVPHPRFPSQMLVGPRVVSDTAPAPAAGGLKDVIVAVAKATLQADGLSPANSQPPAGDPPASAGQQDLLPTDELYEPPDPPHLLRENDLAIFKPRADLVLLGPPMAPPPPPGFPNALTWTESVTVGATVMVRTFGQGAPNVPELSSRATFGWQSRSSTARRNHAGQDLASFDPAQRKLPRAFSNRFFNGGWYGGGGAPAFAHLAPGARIRIQSSATFTSGANQATGGRGRWLRLPATPPVMRVSYRSGPRQVVTQPVDMRADTVVYRRDEPSFYVVWRGSWDLDSVTPRDRYVRVEVV
jgi:hypothetical protein